MSLGLSIHYKALSYTIFHFKNATILSVHFKDIVNKTNWYFSVLLGKEIHFPTK